jgi:DNA-binding NtrC family response regulator
MPAPSVPTYVLPTRPAAGAGGSFARRRRTRTGAAHAAHNGGNRTRTAEMLGIGVRTLFNKLQDAVRRCASARR